MPYGSICCTYHQLKYLSPNRSKRLKTQEPHKISYLLENGGLGKKKSGELPKAEKDKTEWATGLGRRTRGYIENWDQTGSPEIPDMGETSTPPGLPSGGHFNKRSPPWCLVSAFRKCRLVLKISAVKRRVWKQVIARHCVAGCMLLVLTCTYLYFSGCGDGGWKTSS